MKTPKNVLIILVLTAGLFVYAGQAGAAKSAGELLQDAVYAEETEGNLDAAIKIYEQIINDSSAQRSSAAEAMRRLGMCHIKKKEESQARAAFEKLMAQYPEQTAVIEKVQPLLDEMSSSDPAALMPPDTKAYVEIGNPGRQVETILNMLKGTPFANPLAAIGGKGDPDSRTPGDIMGALLNPSMMAEFKKIRGWAVGVLDITNNNPPVITVLYPGKSDALRGIILAGLGVAGKPAEPIEGMQTLKIENVGGVAYDDNVIIIAQPAERLAWCVKQYKGITHEPTLASTNKSFEKISRKSRQNNALTVWIDGASTYAAVAKQMNTEGMENRLRAIEGIADINNIEDIISYVAIDPNSIVVESGINFKKGQHSIPYGLIRTPNLGRAGFAAVPPGAAAVASVALGEQDGGGMETAQKTVRELTGLDIGRELFANIEQITFFVVPPAAATGEGAAKGGITSCLGLAITSRNPQQTHRLIGEALMVADLAANMSAKGQSAGQETSGPDVGKYLIKSDGNQKIYCYLGQAEKFTIVTLNADVLAASLSAVKNKKSVLTDGVLKDVLAGLPVDSSKLILVNVGGAIKVADGYISQTYNNPDNPAHKTLAQLSQACDKTSIQLRTSEGASNFNLRFSVNELPPLDSVVPILMQLSGMNVKAQVKATNPQPVSGGKVGLTDELKLKWQSGVNAASHKVYFGTGAEDMPMLIEVKNPDNAKVRELKADTTYYWRVDEVLADGKVITGDVWSFGVGRLVGWWKLDETSGSRAADSSGRGNDGVLKGNPVWQPSGGKNGGAIQLGGNDYVEIANKPDLNMTEQITVAAWIKVDKFDKDFQAIVTKGDLDGWVLHRNAGKSNIGFSGSGVESWVTGNTNVDDGKWHHVAAVYDGTRLCLYMDGRLDGSNGASGRLKTNDKPICIGENIGAGGRGWNGLIDDVRIYNYALSADEIAAIYEVKATRPSPSDGGKTIAGEEVRLNFRPALGAVSHKIFFGTEADKLPLLADVSNPGDAKVPKVKDDATYYWRVDEVMPGGIIIQGDVWSFTASGKLLGWWKFDEQSGREASDSSGNGNTGKVAGQPKWQPSGGKIGGALLFDGGGDYVEIANQRNFNATGQITVAAWIKVNRFDKQYQTIVAKGDSAWRLHRFNNNSIGFHATGLRKPGMQGAGVEGKANVNDGQWHHIAAVYDGTKARMYVDGRLDDTADVQGTINTNSASVFIGENSEARGRCWNGLIDDVRIYNYALSENDIKAIYDEAQSGTSQAGSQKAEKPDDN